MGDPLDEGSVVQSPLWHKRTIAHSHALRERRRVAYRRTGRPRAKLRQASASIRLGLRSCADVSPASTRLGSSASRISFSLKLRAGALAFVVASSLAWARHGSLLAQELPAQDMCTTSDAARSAEAQFLAENTAAMNKMMRDMALKPTGDIG